MKRKVNKADVFPLAVEGLSLLGERENTGTTLTVENCCKTKHELWKSYKKSATS